MKSLLLIAICICFYNTNLAQTQTSVFLSPTMQNGGVLKHLLEYPNDPSKFLLIESDELYPETLHYYEYDGQANMGSAPILACNSMSTAPIKVPTGLLFGGNTANDGTEPVFFDGSQSIVMDVNPGSGGSDPVFFQKYARTFFIAFDGVRRQLFEYVDPNQFVQISNETNHDVTSFSGLGQNKVFYQIGISPVGPGAVYTSHLKSSEYVLGVYVDSLIRDKDQFYDWKVLGEVNNQLLIQETKSIFFGNNYFVRRILSFDNAGAMSLLLEDSIQNLLSPPYGFVSFQMNNELKIYDHEKIYSSADGLSLTTDFHSVSKAFREHIILDSSLYFINVLSTDDYELNKFSNGNLNNIYSGEHLHVSIASNNEVYFTDYAGNNMSKLIRLNGNDQITTWNIKTNSTHPQAKNGAIYYNSNPIFLWSHSSSTDNNPVMDVHTLANFLELPESPDNASFNLFPNPISNGEEVIISLERATTISIFDQTGRLILSLHGAQGENKVVTIDLKSGLYLVRAGQNQKKLIVK